MAGPHAVRVAAVQIAPDLDLSLKKADDMTND